METLLPASLVTRANKTSIQRVAESATDMARLQGNPTRNVDTVTVLCEGGTKIAFLQQLVRHLCWDE